MKQPILYGAVITLLLIGGISSSGLLAARDIDASVMLKTAQSLFASGKSNEAIKSINGILKENPKNFEAYKLLGKIFASQNEYEKAEKSFQTAASLDATDGDLFYQLGLLYVKKGNAQGAIRSFILTVKNDPKNYEAYHNLGNIALATGNPKQALEYYNKVMAINPSHQPTIKNMSQISRILQEAQKQKQNPVAK